ncbi:uncharacterized protein CELE_F15G9.2 [Caenorhabditis elegans]|uniref:Uncharacterized protein n=1 Tax=Caenorhabditis elegans TaxID=6239 RepID=UPI000957CB8B|nr:Uncharacterized protein CELE_F15G9.2 [Caenorhabditis elegans]CAA87332.3 Uncharacterized protein CELE_F15G9.2 [Caenorhabditis elegans]|eukprot:NP_001335504.1 Uncharacterized protein CELE_F15G9.2 [Caenorhabditis elegans]
MDFSNSLFNLSKIEDSDNDTYRNSDCLSERFKKISKTRSIKWSSESDLTKMCSYDVAVETMRRNSLEEVSQCMQDRLNAGTENILETGEVSDENSLKKKTFLMNMFRTAVLKVMTDPSGNDVEGPAPPLHNDPSTNLTLLPTQKTKAIYLSQVFKYAVKQTIIHQRQERSSGDPWDEFFYRIYSADKPRIDNARQCHSAGIKLNLNKDLQDKLNFTDYDSSIKDKLTPYKSSSSDRGKRAFENLSRVSSSISKRRQHEISDKDGNEFVAQQQFLPKLPPKRREEVRTNDKERRFRVDKVRYSPDGTSPLSRLFYLPHIPSTSAPFKL